MKQDVRFFESSAVPVDLIVLIDASSSMSDKIEIVHDAAAGFLKTLRPGDRGAVVSFADSVNVLQPLTVGPRAARTRPSAASVAHGSTALNNAVYVSLKQFGQAARQDADPRRQAIVVLSDGEDTSSLVSFDDVLALARRMGVNIYTVAPAVEARRAAAQSRRAPLLLGVGLRDEDAGARDRRAVVLPGAGGAEGGLRLDRDRAREPVFDRLRAGERPRRTAASAASSCRS